MVEMNDQDEKVGCGHLSEAFGLYSLGDGNRKWGASGGVLRRENLLHVVGFGIK